MANLSLKPHSPDHTACITQLTLPGRTPRAGRLSQPGVGESELRGLIEFLVRPLFLAYRRLPSRLCAERERESAQSLMSLPLLIRTPVLLN